MNPVERDQNKSTIPHPGVRSNKKGIVSMINGMKILPNSIKSLCQNLGGLYYLGCTWE